MEIRHVSPEDRAKAIAIVILFAIGLAGTVWYSRSQEWVLVVEIAALLFVAIVFAFLYDYFVIR